MNRPIRVLIVYYEPFTSGQSTHVLSLVRGLRGGHFEITVVLPDLLSNLAETYREAGARVEILPIRRLLWKPAAVAGLVKLVRRGAFDLVHVHSQEAGLVARPLAWIGGARRILYTPQTIDIRRKRWHWLVVRAERLLARLTNRILSVNEADRLRLIQWGIPPEKVLTVYNAVDVEAISVLHPDPAWKLPGPVVMQLGRLSEQKDPLQFVAGAKLVLKQIPETRFVMIGDGPLRPAVEQAIRELGLQEKVSLMGAVPQAAAWSELADVVTLTSLWEGTPYSLLEAMVKAKPVVSTAVNGCPEVVVDGVTGWLVPAAEPAAWAARVVDLLKNPEMAHRMGLEGRKRVEEKFSLPDLVSKIAKIYESCADLRGIL